MNENQKLDALREAMNEYRVAVLKGLRCDRFDGCWQRAVLAFSSLFDAKLVERCRKELDMDPMDRPGSK